MVMNQLHSFSGNTVTPELRSFAVILNFYSLTAYNYVRKTFNKCLPHPSTIRKWYSTIDGTPGITQESLNAIVMKVTEMKQKNLNLVCGLIIDKMSISEAVHFNGKHLIYILIMDTKLMIRIQCQKLQKFLCF